MNAQPISIATIKKWEAIACDRSNHALVVYLRDDGLFVVDVFEVTDVFENEAGIPCLQALSLSTKYNGPTPFGYDSVSTSPLDRDAENAVEIPLTSIIESHRYHYGTGFNDIDIRRYYESVAKVRQRQHIQTMSRSTDSRIRFPEIGKSGHDDLVDLLHPWIGCGLWLLYTVSLLAFVTWLF